MAQAVGRSGQRGSVQLADDRAAKKQTCPHQSQPAAFVQHSWQPKSSSFGKQSTSQEPDLNFDEKQFSWRSGGSQKREVVLRGTPGSQDERVALFPPPTTHRQRRERSLELYCLGVMNATILPASCSLR